MDDAVRAGADTAPVCVGIPTYARGQRVLDTLARVYACDPPPREVIVHVDASDGTLEQQIRQSHPSARTLSSPVRVGPGGGRHRCAAASSQPFMVSFDDDSWPVDSDFFAQVVRFMQAHPEFAVVGAQIQHRGQAQPLRSPMASIGPTFTGCGYAIRLAAYRQIPGNIDRPWAYGIEESDVALQLYCSGWKIATYEQLRVFHDTEMAHHRQPQIVAAAIENVALLAYLRYPVMLWPWGLLQLANRVAFSLRRGDYSGVVRGLAGIPGALMAYSSARCSLPAGKVLSYLKSRNQPHDRFEVS